MVGRNFLEYPIGIGQDAFVIGAIEQTVMGNIVIRYGVRMKKGWEQRGTIVLSPDENNALVIALAVAGGNFPG